MSILRILVWSLAFAWSTSSAQSAIRFDGDWWRSSSSMLRTGFVAGYVEARKNALMLAPVSECVARGVSDAALLECSRSVEARLRREYFPMPGAFTVGQLEDGLNAFFSDYRNRRILFDGAFNYVALSISGRPASELEAMAERLRQASASQ